MSGFKNYDPFRLAIQQMSAQQLVKLCITYKKHIGEARTKQELVGLLDGTMSKSDRLDALRKFVLAGKGGMALIQFIDDDQVADVSPNFDKATTKPKIVHIGKPGELFEGMTHIAWAMLAGKNSFVDETLHLQEDLEAQVIDSFYEHKNRILQVRASGGIAGKIEEAWAELHDIEAETKLRPLGLRNIQEVEKFADSIGAGLKKCKGRKRQNRGFHKVSGEAHPDTVNLVGTQDYSDFLQGVDTTDADIKYTFKGKPVKVGFSFESRTTMLRTLEHEDVWSDLYGKLKKFLKLN